MTLGNRWHPWESRSRFADLGWLGSKVNRPAAMCKSPHGLRRRRQIGQLSVLLILAAFACTEHPLQPPDTANDVEQDLSQARPEEVAASQDIVDPFRPRLAIELSVVGVPKPGAQLTINADAVANDELTGAVLRLSAPEAAAAERGRAEMQPHFPLGAAVPATELWNVARAGAGARFEYSTTISFPSEGYYRVAVLSETKGPPNIEAGRYIYDRTYEELWVLVTDEGGRITETYDPSIIPPGVIPQPGPFATAQKLDPAPNVLAGDAIFVEVVYYDGSQYRAATGANLYSQVYDPVEDRYFSAVTNSVPADGIVALQCIGMWYDWHNQVDLPGNSHVKSLRRIAFRPISGSQCGNTIRVIAPEEPYSLWRDLKSVIPVINSHIGYSRSPVAWTVDYAASNSYYTSGDDMIVFSRHANAWTASHEYGHALHEASLGGLWSASNCNPHTISGPSSYTCALLEGFADYVGDVGAYGDGAGWEGFHVSNRPAEVEGNVAALLHDLVDAANETGDATRYPAFYVATVFKSCQVRIATFWFERNDPSDLAWCLEKRINSTVHSQQFPGISTPASISESATEPSNWNANNVRTTWLSNIGH